MIQGRRIGFAPSGGILRRLFRGSLVFFSCLYWTACSGVDARIHPFETASLLGALSSTPRLNPRNTLTSDTLTPIPFSPTPLLPSSTPSPTPLNPSSTPTLPWPPESWLFPDSEIVDSPAAIGFDVQGYLDQAGGFLGTYRQYLMITGWNTGVEIVDRVSFGCILGQVENPENFTTAMGAKDTFRQDLYGQLVWAVHQISEGYYGWRTNTLTEFSLTDGTIVNPNPDSNAGTVALQYFFAQLYDSNAYGDALDPLNGFLKTYNDMFGDPWGGAQAVEPLISDEIEQPLLTLPFGPGKAWAYTGGPHQAFEKSGPLSALDFAPPTVVTGCYQSEDWIVAMARGLVVRSELGVVMQDLDGDGYEQTGWVLMYLHIENRDRVPLGTYLQPGDFLGHPSCEGGRATGTHVHIVRKYNGEWIPADGEIPFRLDGWTAHAGERPYLGSLTRGEEVVTAHQYGSFISRISRDE